MEGVKGEGQLRRVNAGVLWNSKPAFELIARYIEELRGRGVNVSSVVLIGSRARGDWRPWSDIDLLIVVPKKELKGLIPVGLVDARIYTKEELEEAIDGCEVEVVEAFEDGVVISDDGTWEGLRARYLRVKERYGVKRYKEGWRITKKPQKGEARAQS